MLFAALQHAEASDEHNAVVTLEDTSDPFFEPKLAYYFVGFHPARPTQELARHAVVKADYLSVL